MGWAGVRDFSLRGTPPKRRGGTDWKRPAFGGRMAQRVGGGGGAADDFMKRPAAASLWGLGCRPSQAAPLRHTVCVCVCVLQASFIGS